MLDKASHLVAFSKLINKKVRKYYNHTLQTNPWHREEEPQNTTVTRHQENK